MVTITDVLNLIDLSQYYDDKTMTQEQLMVELDTSIGRIRYLVRTLINEGYMNHSKEFQRIRNSADVKYKVTTKGYRLLVE